MKVCKKCMLEKSESDFNKTRNECKICQKEYNKNYRIYNNIAISNKRKIDRKENPDKYKIIKRKSYVKNKHKILNRNKAWLKNNPNKRRVIQGKYDKKCTNELRLSYLNQICRDTYEVQPTKDVTDIIRELLKIKRLCKQKENLLKT